MVVDSDLSSRVLAHNLAWDRLSNVSEAELGYDTAWLTS